MSLELPMPIPLETCEPETLPMFDRWRLDGFRDERSDKRDYTRRPMACDIWLIDLGGQSVLRCKTDNVGDAGLHAHAPIGFGLAVGQRYELKMTQNTARAVLGPHPAKSLGYGTVIRTEMKLGSGASDRIGFAIRFDTPQLLPA